MIITIIILIIFFSFIGIIFEQYNTLVQLKMKVQQSKSGIDVYLQQRFDLIPNLVNTVKSYMQYEKETLENITKLRAEYNKTKDLKISEDLNNQINRIISIAENYPVLKTSEQFLNLQRNLSKIESQLQAARRLYNLDVTKYNTKIHTIPSNIIAMIFDFHDEYLFKCDINANQKTNITI